MKTSVIKLTVPQLRAAIRKTATFIQKHPAAYRFKNIEVPPDCESAGCIIGWLHHFTKTPGDIHARYGASARHTIKAHAIFGSRRGDHWFYGKMDKMEKLIRRRKIMDGNWQEDPKICAKTLRLFAKHCL